MIKAYRLFTESDGTSHLQRGWISVDAVVEAECVQFEETPAHSALRWYDVSVAQYVLTLAGILEFTTRSGDTLTIYPGDVLLATDSAGACHKLCLINDEPWKRVRVILRRSADTRFVAEASK